MIGKKCIFPLLKVQNNLKNFNKREKMSLGQVDVSHTAKNVGYPAQNVDHTMHNACEKCLYF